MTVKELVWKPTSPPTASLSPLRPTNGFGMVPMWSGRVTRKSPATSPKSGSTSPNRLTALGGEPFSFGRPRTSDAAGISHLSIPTKKFNENLCNLPIDLSSRMWYTDNVKRGSNPPRGKKFFKKV